MEDLSHPAPSPITSLPRRRFLQSATLVAAAAYAPAIFAQARDDYWSRPRALWLRRKETGEEVRTVYWADGKLVVDAYVQCCTLLRDVRAGAVVQMNPTLLDILCGVYGWFAQAGIERPIVVTSGYRTQATNGRTEGSARNSMHLVGRAADIRVPDVPTEYLARLGLYLRGGGVGYYATKQFVHVDSGRLRTWAG
ncbi:DUF882 domain-containing protein [Ralstonia insidiosa]|jgi:uncharacterized protein YcbK (DUF882 family)|uniref:Murein endopeptidase K n=1 Tax=Ralstonia pickettii TaxID=329 RepID=A0AAW4Q8I2_RALPI|nr:MULTISPECIES: DUF882 domain-containing protein [Ralstonia]MBA9846674.1 DUF882 domain-containing protein [Ralstonia pickettii]MBA9851832.1 DUF882 domain-containing protein [Ralstonia pickettii]MBA9869795.1 DUF882 domain-containing protein [Ralstonia insidiosa]MBA9913497.1 DUF882 domain-containing protein [Ralstonia insidiosa]MBA9919812.1 DUF882 domain-containing protein [Ralstonia pickettii]